MKVSQKKIIEAARFYSGFFKGFYSFVVRYRPNICPFEDLLAHICKHSTIFDIGCGSGFLLYLCSIFKAPKIVVGVDPKSKAVETAREIFSSQNNQTLFDFICCSSPKDWPETTFDCITMIDVLHHILPEKQENFIEMAIDKLNPGGTLIIKDMSPRPFIFAFMNSLHDLLLSRQVVHYLDFELVTRSLQSRGFTPIARKIRLMWWYHHTLICFKRDDTSDHIKII